MVITQNYLQDVKKSIITPLLIELTKKDLNSFDGIQGLNYSISIVRDVYNHQIKDFKETNLIFIDGADSQDNQILLFNTLIDKLDITIKDIKNLEVIKESLTAGISIATGGIIGNIFGSFIEKGVDLITDNISENIADYLVDKTLGDIDDIILDKISDFTSDFVDNLTHENIYLTKEAKDIVGELFSHVKTNLSPAQSFNLALKLILSIAIDMPKVIFIKNPHKLDKNSLAILSLLFSYLKDKKDEGIYTGISIIYAYDDETFQPYKSVDKKYEENKKLLDEQRVFTQRYAMLERPTSDIPYIAVKSSMFVGRASELETLKQRYYYSKEHHEITTFAIISAEAGIGKTKLVKKHIKQIIKDQNDSKIIQLSLLNQVGHSSLNTGLSSLIESIVQEAKRLETLKIFTEKSLDKLKEFTKNSTIDMIKNTLGVDKLIDVGTAVYDRVKLDEQMMNTKQNTFGDMDNKSVNQKEEQFKNLNIAIQQLQELSSQDKPIILFVDDIQWIDDTSSEYILNHLSKNFNLHIISTLRPMDANTSLSKAKDNEKLNIYTIKLLDNILNNTPIKDIETSTLNLKGLDQTTLSSLISEVVENKLDYSDILSTTIINQLNNNTEKSYVNTLFAVETINMLCDEKLYRDSSIQKVILNQNNKLSFNATLDDFKDTLNKTFEIIKNKYEKSFTHSAKDIEGKFNLMAYAVLEERLNILKIYFKEYGDIAVNTLLFSSLLGTPFNSNIVKNILKSLSTTDEPLLQPLKSYLNKSSSNTTLSEEHYEIIEEVYEILSRYVSFNSAYSYRHNLLNIFLDKQLEYLLDEETLKKDTKEAKNKLLGIILNEINDEEKKQKFYDKEEQSLDTQEYQNMLWFKNIYKNILEKAFFNDEDMWVEDYIENILSIATLFKNNNQITRSIILEKKSLVIVEKLYEKDKDYWTETYSRNLNNLAVSYQYYFLHTKALELLYTSYVIRKKVYYENKFTWEKSYIMSLINLSISYYYSNHHQNLIKAIKLQEEALLIIEQSLKINQLDYTKMHINILNSLASMYEKNNQFDSAINIFNKVYNIIHLLYYENKSIWVESYIIILSNFALASQDNNLSFSINIQNKILEIIKPLYNNNPTYWVHYYTTSLNNMANFYYVKKQFNEALTIERTVLQIRKKLFMLNPTKLANSYTISLNNIALSYFQIDKLEQAILLFEESLKIRQKEYNIDPEYWDELYIESLKNLNIAYYKNNQISKSLTLMYQQYEICKIKYGESNKQTIEVFNNIKFIENQLKINEVKTIYFMDLIYLSKLVALKQGQENITIENIITSFGFIKFNQFGLEILEQYFSFEGITHFVDGKKYLEEAKQLPNIPFDSEATKIAFKLNEIFKDEIIGVLR